MTAMELTRSEYVPNSNSLPSTSPIVETSRLQLRYLQPTDAPLMQKYLADWEVTKWLARVPYPYTIENANEFIENQTKLAERTGFAIVEKERNILIGGIGYIPTIDDDNSTITIRIGYWMGREHWNRGYTTEAGRALIDYLRKKYAKKCKFVACHFVENNASANVLSKLGFTYLQGNCEDTIESASQKRVMPILHMELLENGESNMVDH